MSTIYNLILAALLCTSCRQDAPLAQGHPQNASLEPDREQIIDQNGNNLEERFRVPHGYKRLVAPASSYAVFLRKLHLRPHGYSVHYYDGSIKENPGIYAAVLTYDAGTKDLQQCADAVMRIRAEYLFATNQKDKIHFRLTNGFVLDYAHWAKGNRLQVNGNKVHWAMTANPADDYASFRKYLDVVFAYAGTLSLSKELKPVAYKDMHIGDVLILGGSPGHEVTVMDMAVNNFGKKVFLLSQSYMPAQEIQILQNPANDAINPWYELQEDARRIVTPQWEFTTGQLMRFEGE